MEPISKPRSRWLNKVKIDLNAMEYVDIDYLNVAQTVQWQASVNIIMNFNVS
jgi:hypothetical protein